MYLPFFCLIGKSYQTNAPHGCALRGDEVYASHTAQARKSCEQLFFVIQYEAGADVPEWEQAQEESATWHGEKD